MARINLLPWREEQRKEAQRMLLSITGMMAFFTVLVIVAWHIEVNRQIGEQNRRNQYLQSQITEVEKQITEITSLEKEKRSLQERIKVIQRLQQNRPEVVHLFDEIPRLLPDGMYLTRIKQSGSDLFIDGVAQSNARVSAFMRNIEESSWLKEPTLDVIKKVEKAKNSPPGAREFSLKAIQTTPEEKASGSANKVAVKR